MLLEPTLDKLNAMKLYGMAEALRRFADTTKKSDVAPQELVAMLADAEWLSRENRALTGRLRRAEDEFFVGNLYLNRKCTGAMVGCHPFGGFNMSGTDSKAGGPDYLLQFLQGKSVAERVI